MPSRPKPPPDSELEESYLKGSGPGGQKINKTNSAVQLKHIPTGIVVKSQATRSRAQNRKHAREVLAQKLDDLHNGDESRSNIVGKVMKKRADSARKKSRRKYKKLEEEKARDSANPAPGEQSAESGVDAAGCEASLTPADADLGTMDQTAVRIKETTSPSVALDSSTSSRTQNSSKQ
ncbi:hypothetical protein NQ176_g8205 [Zarea fungicola]|uniref:Uncharacterized protein n=1 Tax=Zarea fungicola TaxID=93591 RepID=A0ACC1MTQ3_9HYPO|nr:hypothetical protein NQ176_g8205 [Lecanicillium fungicola]